MRIRRRILRPVKPCELHIEFHELEEKNTWPGQELPASQNQTSYSENMKSQFNMAAM